MAILLYKRFDVKPLDGKIDQFIYFFLLTNLSVRQVKEPRLLGIGCLLLALEPLNLDDEYLRKFKEFQLFIDISVLLALIAVPLVRA